MRALSKEVAMRDASFQIDAGDFSVYFSEFCIGVIHFFIKQNEQACVCEAGVRRVLASDF